MALEALKGAFTPAELSTEHDVHPNMIAQWKQHAQESLPEVLAREADRSNGARGAELKDLHAKIGKLSAENDFLSKAFRR